MADTGAKRTRTRTRPAGHFTHVTHKGGGERECGGEGGLRQDVHTFRIVLHPWVIAHFICILCIACNFICQCVPPPLDSPQPAPLHLLGIVRIPVRTALTIGHSEISHLNALLLLLLLLLLFLVDPESSFSLATITQSGWLTICCCCCCCSCCMVVAAVAVVACNSTHTFTLMHRASRLSPRVILVLCISFAASFFNQIVNRLSPVELAPSLHSLPPLFHYYYVLRAVPGRGERSLIYGQ